MGDFFFMLLDKLKLYFTKSKRTLGALEIAEDKIKALSRSKILDYKIDIHGRLVIETNFRNYYRCMNAIDEATMALRFGESIAFVGDGKTSTQVDTWLTDADDRYLDPHLALIALRTQSITMFDEYHKIKVTKPARAEYYRVRLGLIAEDLTAVFDILK